MRKIIEKYLDEILENTNVHELHLFPFVLDPLGIQPAEALGMQFEKASFLLDQKRGESYYFSYMYKKERHNESNQDIWYKAIISKLEVGSNSWILIASGSKESYNYALEKYLLQNCLKAWTSFLSTFEIISLISTYMRKPIIKFHSFKYYQNEEPKGWKTDCSHGSFHIEQIQEKLDAYSARLMSIRCENQFSDSKITLHRNGYCKGNNPMQIIDELIMPIATKWESDFGHFSHKDRNKGNNFELQSLELNLERATFSRIDDNKKMISAIEEVDDFGYSIIHANPYLSLSIIDYRHGSNIDVYSFGENKIYLVPQNGLSSETLKTICEVVEETFGPATIKEFTDRDEYQKD